jgi:hypothetical protein
MVVYIVCEESWYGGNVRGFLTLIEAENHVKSIKLDSIIHTYHGEYKNNTLYVIVSEHWYGGEELLFFTKLEDAEHYVDNVTGKVDKIYKIINF